MIEDKPTAALITRQSQGEDDSLSLQLQRERVKETAESLGVPEENIKWFDFGVQTGFSSFNKDSGGIDTNTRMETLLDNLKKEAYDYLVAFDDTRIARDSFYWVVCWHCEIGDCQRVYVDDISEDSLVHKVKREVETEVKKEEIAKSKAAIQEKKDRGEPLGKPPKGLEYSKDKTELVKGEDFEIVKQVINLREQDNPEPYSKIKDKTGVPESTAWKICNKYRDKYEEFLP